MSALGRCARFCLSRATNLSRGLQLQHASNNGNFIKHKPQPVMVSFMQRKHLHEAVQDEKPAIITQRVRNRSLVILDENLHLFGYARKMTIMRCFNFFEQHGLNDFHDGLKVLRCTGDPLVDVHPEKRMELTEIAWKHLEEFSSKSGIPLKTSAYNNLLLVYLENKHKFEPHEFLVKMEQNQIEPNRVTYQLLLAAYCENGDIKKASQILEFMKEKDMATSDNVFNRLITGHFRENDVEGAENMINIMQSSGLQPKSETYSSLLQGYAERGDLEAMKKIITTAEENKVPLKSYQIFNSMLSAVISGHEEIPFEMLSIMSEKKMNLSTDIAPVLQQMVCYGHVDIAFRLGQTLFRNVSQESFLIQCMIINLNPDEKYDQILTEFIDKCEAEPLPVYKSIKCAYINHKADWAMKIFNLAKDKEIMFREHMFLPAYALYADSSNRDGVWDAMKLALETIKGKFLARHLFNEAIPVLINKGMTVEEIYKDLKDRNFSKVEVEFAVFATLTREDPSKAIDFAEGKDIQFLTGFLNRACDMKKWWKEYFQILSMTPKYLNNDRNEEHFFEEALKQNQDSADEIVQYFTSLNLKVSVSAVQRMQQEGLFGSVSSENLAKLNEPRKYKRVQGNFIDSKKLENMSDDELMAVLKIYPDYYDAKTMYLKRLCDHEKEDEINKFLSTSDIPGPVSLKHLIEMYSRLGNLPMCLKYLDMMESRYSAFKDADSVLDTSKLLVKEGRFEEIMPHFQFVHENCDAERKFSSYDKWNQLGHEIALFVEPSEFLKFYDQMQSMSFFGQSDFVEKLKQDQFVTGLIDGYLKRGDDNMILEAVRECIKRKQRIKEFQSVLSYFIEKEDSGKLQQVMDLLYVIEGQRNVILTLIYSLVLANKNEEARELAQTPGLTANMNVLDMFCYWLINQSKTEELKKLLEITKDIPQCDRGQMLLSLIKVYVKTGDLTAARNVLLTYEEEGILPSSETLIFLSNAMKEKGLEVDFYVPNTPKPKGSEEKSSKSTSSVEKKSLDMEKSKKLSTDPKYSTVLQLMNDDFNKNLSTIFESDDFKDFEDKKKLCDWMKNAKRKHKMTFKKFLVNQGEVDLIEYMKEKLDYGNDVDIAAAKAVSNPTSLIADLDLQSPEKIDKCMSVTLLSILQNKSPDVFKSVTDLLIKNAHLSPFGIERLCNYYLQRSPGVFDDLLKEIPGEAMAKLDTSKMAYELAGRNKREEGLKKLLEFSKKYGKSQDVYAALLQIYNRVSDVEKSKQTLADMKSEGHSFDKLSLNLQKGVKDLFSENNLQNELNDLLKKW